MTSNTKTVLMRFVRGAAAVAVASVAAFVISSDFLSIVPDAYDFVVVMVVAPVLLAAEKYIRDGGDAAA